MLNGYDVLIPYYFMLENALPLRTDPDSKAWKLSGRRTCHFPLSMKIWGASKNNPLPLYLFTENKQKGYWLADHNINMEYITRVAEENPCMEMEIVHLVHPVYHHDKNLSGQSPVVPKLSCAL